MRRRYWRGAVLAGLALASSSLPGTAGAQSLTPPSGTTVNVDSVNLQKCEVFHDVGPGKVMLKKNKVDPGKPLMLKAGEKLVVCLDVKTLLAARGQLLLVPEPAVGEVPCTDQVGTGVSLRLAADVSVDAGFHADASLTAKAFARSGNDVRVSALTGLAFGRNNDSNDPIGVNPSAYAVVEYCATVRATSDEIVDLDGIHTATVGSPVLDREVADGHALTSFPCNDFPETFASACTDSSKSGLGMFDKDGDKAWTQGVDDLHAEGYQVCATARLGAQDWSWNGVHEKNVDCVVLDANGDIGAETPPAGYCNLSKDEDAGRQLPADEGWCPPVNLKFHDRNGTKAWENGEDIVVDKNNDGVFN